MSYPEVLGYNYEANSLVNVVLARIGKPFLGQSLATRPLIHEHPDELATPVKLAVKVAVPSPRPAGRLNVPNGNRVPPRLHPRVRIPLREDVLGIWVMRDDLLRNEAAHLNNGLQFQESV